ncbi:ATP-binding protein [Thermophagus sp. OGC60D27]|uniref:ATP-binding protein n=1 Tax=Thermophagus sp. OGC60D27 TaxID=3458415 RepID=UPI004037C7BC
MRSNWPERYINTKVTTGFVLLLIVAALAFGINYFGVVRHLSNHPRTDPVGKRLLLLNELIFRMQDVDRASRIYVLTGLRQDHQRFKSLNDSVHVLLDSLGIVFSDTLSLTKVDTLKILYDQKRERIQQLFELSEINRYRSKYQDVRFFLPDSLNYQISQITYSHFVVDSVETPILPDEDEEKITFLGRISRFITGNKGEDSVVISPTPKIHQIVDSSFITKVTKDPAIEKVRKQLDIIEKQDRRFSELLLGRERSLIRLDDQLTGTIREIVHQLQGEALAASSQYQEGLTNMRIDLLQQLIFLGISALIIIIGFVFWINRDLRRSRRMKEQLVKSKEKVESLMKTKERFLANMSHEIRTPLTSIIGFSELMKSDNHSAEIIYNAAQHLLALVNDILDMSQMNEGKITLHYEAVHPDDLVREVWETFIGKAKEKEINFRYSIGTDIPTFRGDKTRLQQILINLVGNAIKFTGEGAVIISLEKEEKDLLFAVKDTGPGLSVDDPNELFEAFSRFNTVTSPKASGSGLGLAISKKLVEAMEGTIGFRNNAEKGCTFWFRIPLLLPTSGRQNHGENKVLVPDGKNLLVVDDDPLVQQLLRGFLKHHTNIHGCSTATEALEWLDQGSFDLIISDYRMPGMNGVEFVKEIRKRSTVPVLLFSAAANQHLLDETSQMENITFLPKPFSKSDLLKAIRRLIEAPTLPHEDVGNKEAAAAALYDLNGVLSFTGEDQAFLASVVTTFIHETNKNLIEMSFLIRKRKFDAISDLAHKMLTGFRQYAIEEGVAILKGMEVMSKPGYHSQLKRSFKRLKKHWKRVEKELEKVNG